MVAEYFLVRTRRPELESSRAVGRLPEIAPLWVPATLVVWGVAALVGKYVEWGLPSVSTLVLALVASTVLGRLGLTRGVGTSRTDAIAPPAPRASTTVAEPVAG